MDGILYLTGMQTWVNEVNHRALNGLYYASVQWNLYLMFALAVYLYQVGNRWWCKTFGASSYSMSLSMATFIYLVGQGVVLCALLIYIWYYNRRFVMTECPTQFIPCFIAGILSAWYLHHVSKYTYGGTPVWWRFVPRSAHQGWQRVVVARGWALSVDIVAALIIYVVVYPHIMSTILDLSTYLVILPIMTSIFVVMLLLTQTDRQLQPSPIIKYVLESDAANILGQYAYPIYLFHEMIGDVYMRYAVMDLYRQWNGMIPPPHTPWYTKYQMFLEPWMSSQSYVLKLATLSLTIVVSWLVTHYVTEGVFLDVLNYLGGGIDWAKRKMGKACRRHHHYLLPCANRSLSTTTTTTTDTIDKSVDKPPHHHGGNGFKPLGEQDASLSSPPGAAKDSIALSMDEEIKEPR